MTTNRASSSDLIALASAALLTAAGDYLFWWASPGISIGLFAVLAAALLLLNQRGSWRRNVVAALLILLPTAAQTGVELSFSNLLVLAGSVCVLLGETTFPDLRAGWPRWSEAAWNLMRPFRGWMWGAKLLACIPVERRRLRGALSILFRVLFPAAALSFVFLLLLSFGNAVVGYWTSDTLSWFFSALARFDFSIARLFLWLVLASFALTLLRRDHTSHPDRLWTRTVPEFRAPADPAIARWRSVAILALLNGLFFAANTADALYLWTSTQLPDGVSYSAFVHRGVYSLIAAVVLSAIILTLIMQQAPSVRGTTPVRLLSLVWIVQNLVLIAGVLLRLVRYVEAYQLSELRVYVACFLLLVTIGFGALALHVLVPRGLNRLIFINVLATFALFFTLQFLDVARWVAETNVARWQQDRTRTLDVVYLDELGPSATSSLIEVAETPDRSEAHDAFVVLQTRKEAAERKLAALDWRSWQTRKVRNARLLVNHEVRTRR